jgi:hypothetical protein
VFDDDDKTLAYAKMIQDAGAQILTVHGRTRENKGREASAANWDIIRKIKSFHDRSVGLTAADRRCRSPSSPTATSSPLTTSASASTTPAPTPSCPQVSLTLAFCLSRFGLCTASLTPRAEWLRRNPALFSGLKVPSTRLMEEYFDLVEIYDTPLRIIRAHIFKIMAVECVQIERNQPNPPPPRLMAHVDLREDLTEASTYADVKTVTMRLVDRVKVAPPIYSTSSNLDSERRGPARRCSKAVHSLRVGCKGGI